MSQHTLCLKNISDIIDCSLKKDDQILMFFGSNTCIPDTTGHQMTVQVDKFPPHPTSASALPGRNRRNEILHSSNAVLAFLIKITYIKHILSIFCHFGWQFIQLSASCPNACSKCLKCRLFAQTQARRRFLHSLIAVSRFGGQAAASLPDTVYGWWWTQEAIGWNLDWSGAELYRHWSMCLKIRCSKVAVMGVWTRRGS